jgi:hypothetical protein
MVLKAGLSRSGRDQWKITIANELPYLKIDTFAKNQKIVSHRFFEEPAF